MGNHCNICSFNCWGRKDYDGSCCHLEDRDFIIGRIDDWKEFLVRLSNKIGRTVEFKEVFYDFEEGSKKFPNKPSFQDPRNFPCFRVDEEKKRLPCVNYNSAIRACGVYDIRPNTCRDYFCDHLTREIMMNS
jgi:Fe-S-cluster containining protein